MKRIVFFALALILCVSSVSCGKTTVVGTTQESGEGGSDGESQEQREKFCSVEQAKAFIQTVDVTLENWEEYFEIKEMLEMDKNPLGEETGYEKLAWYFTMKNDAWQVYETVTFKFTYQSATKMEFTNTVTGQTRVEPRYDGTEFRAYEDFFSISTVDKLPRWYKTVMYESDWWCEANEVNENTTIIKDFKCAGVKGVVAKCVIPDDMWNVNEDGERYLLIGDYNGCTTVSENSDRLAERLKMAISALS